MKSLRDLLLTSIIKYPRRKVINNYMYNDIYKLSNKYNNLFNKYNIQKGDRICMSSVKSINWLSVMLSTWNKGGIFVPLPKNNSILSKYIVDTIKPKLIIYDNYNVDNIINNEKVENIDENDPAIILFTSGTTNNPKGVVLSHKNIISNLNMIHSRYENEISQNDSSFSILPWHHCYGLVCELFYLTMNGSRIYIPESNNPNNMFKEIKWKSPSLFYAVPKILETIYKKDIKYIPYCIKRNLIFGKNIRMISVGGAMCNPNLIDFMTNNYKIPTFQGYGMSETSPMISLNNLLYNRIGSVGKPLMKTCFTKENELCVKGDNTMLGYLKEIGDDNEIILEPMKEWFNTGDKGYFDKDGYLYISGRVKTEYKLSNGKYINPIYIESLLSTLPSIEQVLIFGEGDKYNRAIVYTKNKNIQEEIINFLKNKVEDYEIPKEIKIIDEPFTIENGLLTQKYEPNRKKILKLYGF